ncbi:MAG: hypothetical protein ACK4SY_06670 [Pyrobaculum sp.]
MIEKIVGRLVGVEDAPKWVEKEVFRKVEEGLDLEGAVNFLAPWLYRIYRANVAKYRPGRSSIRKASSFLTAELIEGLGYRVGFIHLFGEVMPAAVRGGHVYTPVLPIFDARRKSLYLASKARDAMRNVIQLTATREAEGVLAEVIKLDRPPYYYLTTSANLKRLIEESTPISTTRDKKYEALYHHWRHFRQKGYLVLVGREVGGVKVDLLAVGVGRYAVVRDGGRKIARLRKVVDAYYLV